MSSKHVLFSVLNWGLGHATRSVPVIHELVKRGIRVTIASDGAPLTLLKHEFPNCGFLKLPTLDIRYSASGFQTLAAGKSIVKNSGWYIAEREIIKAFLKSNPVDGIISDNRPTAHDPDIHSVYITHQLIVKAGFLTPVASLGHANFYKRYHEIWVPDTDDFPNLSGDLSRSSCNRVVKFIGPLSDIKTNTAAHQFDVGIVLSGPEPQRTLLEAILTDQLARTPFRVWIVRGTEEPSKVSFPSNWQITHLANREQIQALFEQSAVLVSRCGYSTVMDLYAAPKPAVLIPTPKQPEQEYLASLRIHQHNFAINKQEGLHIEPRISEAVEKFKDFEPIHFQRDWDALFRPFLG